MGACVGGPEVVVGGVRGGPWVYWVMGHGKGGQRGLMGGCEYPWPLAAGWDGPDAALCGGVRLKGHNASPGLVDLRLVGCYGEAALVGVVVGKLRYPPVIICHIKTIYMLILWLQVYKES